MSKYSSVRALAPAVALSLVLVGCADKAEEGPSSIDVNANDTACEVGSSETSTGSTTFKVVNNGTKTNEFYVMTSGGRVLGEVENIGPGASRTLVVEFQDAGDYTTLCKPGMVGDGIRSDFVVTGDAVIVDPSTRAVYVTTAFSADRLSISSTCDPADTPLPPGTAHDEPSAVVPRTSYD